MDKKLLVNKSITDKISKNSVILDPAGLYFMKNGFQVLVVPQVVFINY